MAKLTSPIIRKLAETTGITIGGWEGSPYPTYGQLKAFIEAARALEKPAEEVRLKAIKIAKKHKLIAGAAPNTMGECWIVDAISEALTSHV